MTAYSIGCCSYLKDEQVDEDNNALTVDEDDRTEHYEQYHGKSRIGRLMASYALLFVTCCVPVSAGLQPRRLKSYLTSMRLMSCSD